MESLENNISKKTSGWVIFTLLFIFTFLYLGRIESLQKNINNIVAPAVFVVFFLKFGFNSNKYSTETFIYFFFFIWCLIGYPFVIDYDFYWKYIKIFLIILMLIYILENSNKEENSNIILFAYIVGGLFVVIDALFFNEQQQFEEVNTERLKGLTGNSNGLGYFSLLGFFSIGYLWKGKYPPIVRTLFLVAIGVLITGIVLSASRKSFLSLSLFIGFWIYFTNKKIFQNPLFFIITFIVLLFTFYELFDYIAENTFLGKRLEAIGEEEADKKRAFLYAEGIAMFLSNPIYGVGLGNFLAHSSLKAYSHSDLIEIVSTTGIVGLTLYVSIYITLLRRIVSIKRLTDDQDIIYKLNIIISIIIVLFLIGLGRPHFLDIFTMSFLFILVGESSKLKRKISNV